MQRHSLALTFILCTVTLDAIGIGIIFPVMPDLIREVTGKSLSEAALWGGSLATSFAVMQVLFGPLIGALSDRFGRRPVLLLSVLIMALDYLVMAVAHTIWLLLAARVIAGITAATCSTATAYVADITPPEERGSRFGLIGAGFGIGFGLGPLIRRFGEHRAAHSGMWVNVITLTGLGLVTSPILALAITPITALGGVVTPALQALASRSAPANAQGELQGVLSSLSAIAMITSPLIMTTTFCYFTSPTTPVFSPGAPFLLASTLMLACIALHVLGPRLWRDPQLRVAIRDDPTP